MNMISCISKCNTATERTHLPWRAVPGETFEKKLLKLIFSVVSLAKKTFARGLLMPKQPQRRRDGWVSIEVEHIPFGEGLGIGHDTGLFPVVI